MPTTYKVNVSQHAQNKVQGIFVTVNTSVFQVLKLV